MRPARIGERHTSRNGLREEGIRTVLGNCGAVNSQASGQTRGMCFKAGAKKSFEFQNVLGIRGRKGKPKNPHLKDSLKERIGPHLVGVAAQRPGQIQGVLVGPCPVSLREQNVRSMGMNSHNTLWTECKGRIVGKNDMANPRSAEAQEREASVIEERGSQETTSSQVKGCSEGNNIKQAMSREERSPIKDKGASKEDDEGSYYCVPEKEPVSCSVLGDYIQAGGKSKCSPRNSEMKPVGLREEDKGEEDTSVGRSVRLGGFGMGNLDGTRSETSGREHHYQRELQEEMQSGSGQSLGAVRGSDLDKESGRIHFSPPGVGMDYQEALCPDPIKRARLIGLIHLEPICSKVQDAAVETGLSQGLVSRSIENSVCLGPISCIPDEGHEGFALHHGEGDELSVVAAQEDSYNLKNRYDDNLYARSTPIPISVFGRPLLSGGFSGQGASTPDKPLVPLRVVAAGGREWGLESLGAISDVGEETGVAGQRKTEVQLELLDYWNYGSWKSSCLAKFNEFLRFPTKGFEKEIINLLRKLVDSQNLSKEKGILSVSKSERELRRLRCTINYNGNKSTKGGGRDRGDLLLKLK